MITAEATFPSSARHLVPQSEIPTIVHSGTLGSNAEVPAQTEIDVLSESLFVKGPPKTVDSWSEEPSLREFIDPDLLPFVDESLHFPDDLDADERASLRSRFERQQQEFWQLEKKRNILRVRAEDLKDYTVAVYGLVPREDRVLEMNAEKRHSARKDFHEPDYMRNRVPNYRIKEKPFSKGGMGEVYEGYADLNRQKVVLKRPMLAGYSEGIKQTIVENFIAEARVMAGLSHPGIPMIHDLVVWKGEQYMVMERLFGPNLAQLTQQGFRDIPQVMGMFKDVCEVVDFMAKKGVLHGDLKPENILYDFEQQRAVVTDFEISNLVTQGSEMVWVSPTYSAPEQMRGAPLTLQSEVYALGGVLFYLLMGEPDSGTDSRPYNWLNSQRTVQEMYDRLSHQYRLMHKLPKDAAMPFNIHQIKNVIEVIKKAKAAKPENRYQSATELLNAVGRCFASSGDMNVA